MSDESEVDKVLSSAGELKFLGRKGVRRSAIRAVDARRRADCGAP